MRKMNGRSGAAPAIGPVGPSGARIRRETRRRAACALLCALVALATAFALCGLPAWADEIEGGAANSAVETADGGAAAPADNGELTDIDAPASDDGGAEPAEDPAASEPNASGGAADEDPTAVPDVPAQETENPATAESPDAEDAASANENPAETSEGDTAVSAPEPVEEPVAEEPATETPATGVGFIYVDDVNPAVGNVQNIAVVLDDPDAALVSARLTYIDPTGASRTTDATALAGDAALFQPTIDTAGTYQLAGLTYTTDADSVETYLDLLAASDEPCSFEGIDAAALPATLSDLADDPGAASFYALTGDGELQEASDLGEAVALSATATPSTLARTGSEGFVIALDPGHGGWDSGAGGYGLTEANLNWRIAQYCKEALEQYAGVTVVLTREENECPEIKERVERAYAAGANVIVSIHINSEDTGLAHGAEVWYPTNSSWKYDQTHVPGEQLAQNILGELVSLGLNNRGYKVNTIYDEPGYNYPDGSYGDYYGILRYARQYGFVGIIVEHAFVSNWSDAQLLASDAMLREMGYADARGIAATYGLSTTEAPQALFGDALPGSWYVDGGWISYVVDNGLMTGVKDDDGVARNFYPDESLTRGQLATILYRAAFPDATDTTNPQDYLVDNGFADTPVDENGKPVGWYYNAAIKWCADQGIVTGYTEGPDKDKFLPDDPVTREEMATMVYRFAHVMGIDVSGASTSAFETAVDHADVEEFAVDAMTWCAAMGIINGNTHEDGSLTLEPQAGATRAQAAKVVTVLFRDVLG